MNDFMIVCSLLAPRLAHVFGFLSEQSGAGQQGRGRNGGAHLHNQFLFRLVLLADLAFGFHSSSGLGRPT